MIISFIAGVAVASFLHYVINDLPTPKDVGPDINRYPLDQIRNARIIGVNPNGPTPGVEFPGEWVRLRWPDGTLDEVKYYGAEGHWPPFNPSTPCEDCGGIERCRYGCGA